MKLEAISLGYAIPQNGFTASVHSCFTSVVNLKLNGRWDLLTLVAEPEVDLPQGIRLDTPTGFSFEDIRVNDPVTCDGGSLSINGSALVIEMTRAKRWECQLQKASRECMTTPALTAWRYVWQILNERQLQCGTEVLAARILHPANTQGSALFRRLSDGTTKLMEATSQCGIITPGLVSTLIGLGPGLTPSGDDLLVGYMVGLFCRIGENEIRRNFISNLGKDINAYASRTTDISRTYLYHSTHAQVSRQLAVLAEALCTGQASETLQEKAIPAMQMGHSSGMDAVTGLLLGFSAWDRDLFFPGN
jgi:hypothetical protein